jgi:hypothetical protein
MWKMSIYGNPRKKLKINKFGGPWIDTKKVWEKGMKMKDANKLPLLAGSNESLSRPTYSERGRSFPSLNSPNIVNCNQGAVCFR